MNVMESANSANQNLAQNRDTLVAAIEKCLIQAHKYLIALEEMDEPMIKNNGYLMATGEK